MTEAKMTDWQETVMSDEAIYLRHEIDWTDNDGEPVDKVTLGKHELVALLAGWQDTSGTSLMKVLVDGGIVLKDATPTPSELLLAVEDVIKNQAQAKHTGELAEAVIVWMCYFAQRQERDRIIGVIESLNSIGYAYGADYKTALLQALRGDKGE